MAAPDPLAHLAWPFLDDRHRALGASLEGPDAAVTAVGPKLLGIHAEPLAHHAQHLGQPHGLRATLGVVVLKHGAHLALTDRAGAAELMDQVRRRGHEATIAADVPDEEPVP